MLEEMYSKLRDKMDKSIKLLKSEFMKIRTGRANPGILADIKVDSYGTLLPLSQIASIGVPEPRLIVVRPWDKNLLLDIERAIHKSGLGLTPSNDGNVIRLPVPELTEERRKEIVKLVKRLAEENKVAIRNIRREVIHEIKTKEKNHEISEDNARRGEKEVQKITDECIEEVDKILENKEKEIMEV